ncbi:UNVERIFIED_CONTAM: hypothetical protein Slati_0819500 [Sesamum latifolium]|uniref:Zinc knuckle CX2CX4HX4C domain-containing protein n=1 Tax=Sesamum latifolium TaxID=2727402 RepID=A0AAW2XLV7_9LAMI
MEADESGCSWGASLRIRVSIDVTKPLKRVLKLKSPSGNELLVQFTCERLPNLCYLCGCLGHVDKFCEVRFEEGFQDHANDTPYGPWLRASPPGRGRQAIPSVERPSTRPGASHGRPPCRLSAAVFGSFKVNDGVVGRGEPGEHNNLRSAGTQGIGRGIGGRRWSRLRGGLQGVLNGDGLQVTNDSEDGLDILSFEGGTHNAAEFRGKLDLNLVNVPLQFTAQNPVGTKGIARRGRPAGRCGRGRPRKRYSGGPVLENDSAYVHIAKRRLCLIDDSSDSISAETAGQSHREL